MTRIGTGWCPFADQVEGLIEGMCWNRGGAERVGFCDHTAEGYYSTLTRASFWNGTQTSAHFAISKKGQVAQLVNIFDTAWAQGKLGPHVVWPPYPEMEYHNPNGYLISIEHEDETEPDMVWPEAMYRADLRVKRWCMAEVKRITGKDLLRFGLDSLASHAMFDQVTRLHCPGDNWPRIRLYQDLLKEGGLTVDERDELEERRAGAILAHNLQVHYRTRWAGGPDAPWLAVELFNNDGSPTHIVIPTPAQPKPE